MEEITPTRNGRRSYKINQMQLSAKNSSFMFSTAIITGKHWIQSITFAAETNVACSRGSMDRQIHRRQVSQYLLHSLSGGEANKKHIMPLETPLDVTDHVTIRRTIYVLLHWSTETILLSHKTVQILCCKDFVSANR